MSSPEERWDGEIQDAVRDWDEQQGHLPEARSTATRVTFFQPPIRPNGGTVYVRPSDSGNPYAHVDENEAIPHPYTDVQLPDLPEGEA